jgi:uncharacterized SAM-binding protein YcdF (DUF218 family)
VANKAIRKRTVALAAFLSAAGLTVGFHRTLLTAAGDWLIVSDPLQKTDAAIVLSGEESEGLRVRGGVDLYKAGWVRKLVLSGTRSSFGRYETDYSSALAISLGVPKDDMLIVTHRMRNTYDEAKVLLPVLEERGLRSVIVVTSNYHTRRARMLFREAIGDRVQVRVYPVHSEWFAPDAWWQSREGLKTFLLESTKIVDAWVEH